MSQLFRAEVLRARDAQYLGTIRIARRPSFTLVTVVAVVLGACLVAYAVLGEVTRKARLSGVLVPVGGTLNVTAPQVGTVVDVKVQEGDVVTPGQALMTVRVDRSTSGGDAALLIAQSVQQRRVTLETERSVAIAQSRQRQQALSDRARSLDAEARQADGEISVLRGRADLARKSAERYAELGRSGFVSQLQVQQREEELLDVAARLSVAERSFLAVQREAQSLRSELAALDNTLRGQLAQIDRSLALMRQEDTENSARRELVIVAPEPGTVTAVNVQRGQMAQPGQTVVALIPHAADGRPSPLQAHLFAPSRSAGFVDAGQEVWIRFAAYPYQKFGMARGRIASVSRTPVSPHDLAAGQGSSVAAVAQSAEPLYRIVVSLENQTVDTYGDRQPLKAGMTLDADAIQDRRRIWEWVLEPVLAASGLSRLLAEPPR